jgi:hypothetical protein
LYAEFQPQVGRSNEARTSESIKNKLPSRFFLIYFSLARSMPKAGAMGLFQTEPGLRLKTYFTRPDLLLLVLGRELPLRNQGLGAVWWSFGRAYTSNKAPSPCFNKSTSFSRHI